MPAVQALIKVNGVVGTNDDVPIATLVQLDNQDAGGETTYAWAILDQPDNGMTDSLSATNVRNPTFTPRKQGTYLIKLTVNAGAPTEVSNTVVVAVRQLRSLFRIPAAGETTEDDAGRGWKKSLNLMLQHLDRLTGDTLVGYAGMNGITTGKMVVVLGSTQLVAGVVGERVPVFALAEVARPTADQSLIAMALGKIGGGTPAAGDLMAVKLYGVVRIADPGFSGIGAPAYLSDTSTIDKQPGSVVRRLGYCGDTDGVNATVWLSGGWFETQPVFWIGDDVNPVVTPVEVQHRKGIPGAAGDAVQVKLSVDNDANAPVPLATLAAFLETETAGTEAGSLRLSTRNAGALAERMRVLPNGAVIVGATVLLGSEMLRINGRIACSDPTTASEAATKGYVDGKVPSIITWGAANANSNAAFGAALYPGFGAAAADDTRTIEWTAPFACKLSKFRLRAAVGPNGANEVYEICVGGFSVATVGLTAGSRDGINNTDVITLAAGDKVAVLVDNAPGIVVPSLNVVLSAQLVAA